MNKRVKVTVSDGVLEGSFSEDGDPVNNYYSFQGIPYAKPPIGENRFKAPQPCVPWQGARDATQDGEQCFSRHVLYRQEKVGSEDCLFLNVYTPQIPEFNNGKYIYNLKPVMFFIHGGSFIMGSNSKEVYGPDYLVREDVVLVTINYRLGALGFLQLEDPSLEVPGNAGFKDMVMALKWVKQNIQIFNGNSENITIFGESAGAAATHCLVLSPMAKGLFHKAILQSGCAVSLWCQGVKFGKELIKHLGKNPTSEKELLSYLNGVPLEELYDAQEKLRDTWDVSEKRPFGIVLEKPNSQEPAFLSEEPVDLLQSGRYHQVPLIVGYNSREGMLVDAFSKKDINHIIPTFEMCVPYDLKIPKQTSVSKIIANKIRTFYFGNNDLSNIDIDQYYKLQTDNFFLRDIYRAVKMHLHTSGKPIFLYRMSIETSLNLYKILGGIKEPGVCHADDIGYLFKNSYVEHIEPNSNEDKGIRRFCKFWSNFAKHGDPNPIKKDPLLDVVWKPVNKNKIYFMDIDKKLHCDEDPEKERMDFWNSIYTSARPNNKL